MDGTQGALQQCVVRGGVWESGRQQQASNPCLAAECLHCESKLVSMGRSAIHIAHRTVDAKCASVQSYAQFLKADATKTHAFAEVGFGSTPCKPTLHLRGTGLVFAGVHFPVLCHTTV